MQIKIRGVKLYRSRGKLFAYHRASRRRLRAPLGSAAFFAEVARLDNLPRPAAQPGDIGRLDLRLPREPGISRARRAHARRLSEDFRLCEAARRRPAGRHQRQLCARGAQGRL
jgi:hypothetical protein